MQFQRGADETRSRATALRKRLVELRVVAATGTGLVWEGKLPRGHEKLSWARVLQPVLVNRLLEPRGPTSIYAEGDANSIRRPNVATAATPGAAVNRWWCRWVITPEARL
ncbi:MAG TPA: hypothetical protein VKV15_26775 [Bryobacteraceae bacterium]|nr:hypothetical protein [Bryobacteraceae bacterium]